MKKVILSILFLLTVTVVWAQVPQQISYQSVIRDGNNVVVASSPVGIKVSLLKGTATGPAVYVETHRKTTNMNGLVSLEIGTGTVLSGSFANIDWANGPYLIQTETDPTGGANYSIPAVLALNSVPYALYAANGTPGPKGEKGEAGATGPQGPIGLTGPTGPQGQAGATGPQGAIGLTGAIGPAGAAGPQGTIGLTGPAGEAGPTGATGPAGPQGATGLTGATGPAGATGPQGTIGLTGPAGVAGPTGPAGPQGATGPAGATGPQGPIGLTGPAGVAGPTGPAGPVGPQGATGLTGATGPAGATGPQGPIGLTGPAGEAGPQGQTGPVGPQGATGLTGATGPVGATGPQGPIGLTGPDGVAGPAGAIGPAGPQGATGLLSSGTAAGNTPYWNGSSWVTNSNSIFNNGGNIGIGTGTPTEKLEVDGNLKTSGTLTAGAVTYPNLDGSSGQVLTTNGSGTLSWSSSSGVPYSGATGTVNLGAFDLTVNGITVGKGLNSVSSNSAFGTTALAANTTGFSNTAIGYQTLYSNTSGNANTAIGNYALRNNISSSSNTAVGRYSLWLNQYGTQNTAVGDYSLAENDGYNNTAIGAQSLQKNQGTGNTGSGYTSLNRNTSGNYNTATGYESLYSNTTGHDNTANGRTALYSNLSGNYNTSVGMYSLQTSTTGSYNTAIGVRAGQLANGPISNTTSDYSVYLGSDAKASADNAQNEIVIGYDAIGGGSNTVQLGNTSITNVKTSGTITAGTVTYPSTHGSANQVLSTTGSGTLAWSTPTAGLPTQNNTPGDMLYWDGNAWVKVAAGANGQNLTFYNGAPVWITTNTQFSNTVLSVTGKIWMDRNLGASQVATSSTDANSYGDLYQWGRGADGHQLRTSGSTTTLATTDVPGNDDFIIVTNSFFPFDWRSTRNNDLWQGVNGVNNPCPAGFRLPTKAEWEAEIATWSSQNTAGAFASPLKLTVAGLRWRQNGSFLDLNDWGRYWSSTITGDFSYDLTFNSSSAAMINEGRAEAVSVRCIKD
jgi:uncharacterized protein (TIGR02145 family)